MATPLRNVRVGDEVWSLAARRARVDGTTLTAVIVDMLRRYGAADCHLCGEPYRHHDPARGCPPPL